MEAHEDDDERPLYSRRRSLVLRAVVVLGVASLVLPGLITSISVASSTANKSCAIWVHYLVPDATGASARFEVFGAGGIGLECYTVGAFGGDRHVLSLGLIPGQPPTPAGRSNNTRDA